MIPAVMLQYLGGERHHPDHVCQVNDAIIVQVHVPDNGIYLLLCW